MNKTKTPKNKKKSVSVVSSKTNVKEYNHTKIESVWQKEWEAKKIYQAKNTFKGKKFYGLIEFPYPSGAGLHVGHIRSNTAMDIITRKRRMQGYNTLFPIGWDAFGLPTENYAIKTGIQPEKVTKQNTDTFRKQLKSIGFGFDWSREVNTTDPAYYKWTQWIFLQFYKKGLAYKAKTTINWCPKDKIGLANEEVVNGCCERCGTPTIKKEKEQWMLAITKYADRLDADLDTVNYLPKIKTQQRNWIGKSEGSEIEFSIIEGTSSVKKILIGTRNEAKFRMVKECLPEISGVEFVSLNDIPTVDDSSLVEGMDYIENAKMKAEFYFKKTGIPTLSLDNVFWLEKWKKDNGVMIHMRKEANPKSERATDEEVITYLKKWVKKVGGKSKAHFMYAVAFADEHGTKNFVSIQREYILQEKQSKNFWPGYPSESLLVDVKTHEYKGDQENSVRYGILIADLEKNKQWFTTPLAIKVFTTRADTIYGATYVVLAPEHPLVENLKSKAQNQKEIEAYVAIAKKKDDLERTAEGKEKTGVELVGVTVRNPANGEVLPVWIADYVLAQYGTGAVMAVPAHDERDYAFAQKYNLPIRKVIEPEFFATIGNSAVKKELPFVGREAICAVVRNPKDDSYLCLQWKNMDARCLVTGGIEEGEDIVESARREVLEETGYKNLKLTAEPCWVIHTYFYHLVKNVNRHARFHYVFFDIIDEVKELVDEKELAQHEPVWKKRNELKDFFNVEEAHFMMTLIDHPEYIYTGDGILINSGSYSGTRSDDVRNKIAESVGGKIVTKYKLRDWVFSRQRYWGEPIPIIHCEKCGYVPVPEKDLPVVLPKVKSYQPTDNGESPLAIISKWVNTTCPTCNGKAKRETDTMPNWAGSSWYYLRYVDPKNKKEFASKKSLKYFTPVDWYNGGMEHTTLHLLYSRFWHKFLYDLKLVPTSEPYMKRTSHGMILASGGVKMSKSIGNTINPEDIVKLYGADTLRIYEMFMGPFDQAVSWDTTSIIGSRRFLEKVWKNALHTIAENSKKTDEATEKMLHKTIKKVGEDIETMSFNTAISSMMVLSNEIERSKKISIKDYKLFLQILGPFAPHISEELWRATGEKRSIHVSVWPKFNPKKIIDESVKIAVQVNGKVRTEMVVDLSMSEDDIKSMALQNSTIAPWVEGKEIKRVIYVPSRLVNIVV